MRSSKGSLQNRGLARAMYIVAVAMTDDIFEKTDSRLTRSRVRSIPTIAFLFISNSPLTISASLFEKRLCMVTQVVVDIHVL